MQERTADGRFGEPPRPVGRLGDVLWSGMGLKPTPSERALGDALTAHERRWARRQLLRGRPAWSEESALFALAYARQFRRSTAGYPAAAAVALLAMGGLLLAGVVDTAGDDDMPLLLAVFCAVLGLFFVVTGAWTLAVLRPLRRGIAANLAVLSPQRRSEVGALPAPKRPTRRSRLGEVASLTVGAGLVQLLLRDLSLWQALLSGAIFAAIFVGISAVGSVVSDRRERL